MAIQEEIAKAASEVAEELMVDISKLYSDPTDIALFKATIEMAFVRGYLLSSLRRLEGLEALKAELIKSVQGTVATALEAYSNG